MPAAAALARARTLAGRPSVQALAALAALALSAAYLSAKAPLSGIGEALAAANWTWVAVAVCISVVGTFMRAASWHVVIRAALPDAPVGRRAVLGAYAAGVLANLLLPGKLGEAARTCAIARRVPGPAIAPVAGTVLAHRLLDLVPVLAVAAIAVTLTSTPTWLLTGMAVTAIVAVVLAVAVLVALRTRRSSELGLRIEALVRRTLAGFAVVRQPTAMALAMSICGASWLLRLLMVVCAMLAFGVVTSLAAGALVLLAVSAARSVPLLPGGVGLLQVGVALALVGEGIGYEQGIAFGLGFQAIETLATAIFGGCVAGAGGLTWLGARVGLRPRTA